MNECYMMTNAELQLRAKNNICPHLIMQEEILLFNATEKHTRIL